MKLTYRILWTACAAAAALIAAAVLPDPLNLPLFFLVAGAFTLPGWPLARYLAGDHADGLTRTVLALPIGYASGAVLTVLLRWCGIGNPWAVVGGCLSLAAGLWVLLRRRSEGTLVLVPLTTSDRVAMSVLWIAALLITGPVFGRVGEATPLGLAYRAYFNADLFVHMSVVAEVAKGTSPAINPFFPIEALPYYWTYFSLPAVFSQFRPTLPVDSAIMLTDSTMALVFISVGFLTLRNLGVSTIAAAVSWLVVLFASSFEGAFFIWDQVQHGKPVSEFRFWNIDAVTRWVWNVPGVDGFHRGMWWTPQHLMALTLGMIVLLSVTRPRKDRAVGGGIMEGLLLGAILIISSFNGVMLVGWYGVTQAALLALDRGRGAARWFFGRLCAATLVLLFLGLATSSGMVQRIPNAFLFGWNRYFLRGPWAFLLLSFGPALFFAPFGVRSAIRQSIRMTVALALLMLVSAIIFLQLDLRGHENTQVTFRTGQLWYICLAVFLGFAIDAWRRSRATSSRLMIGLLGLSSIIALPTVAFDWYNARDLSNIENSPGNFPWTLHISHDDQLATGYIHAALPLDATVQTDALPRERNTWALIPAFARRRMATGNGLFTLNPNRYLPTQQEVHTAFGPASADEAHAILARLGVHYVYVGDVERRVNGESVYKFALRPDLFEPAFWHGSVNVYRVR